MPPATSPDESPVCQRDSQENYLPGAAPQPQVLDIPGDIQRIRDAAQKCRDSFVSYFQFCGRNREGIPLLLDPERLRSAEACERAYFAGKDYYEEALRGSLKTSQAVYFHAWILGRNPNLTVLHYSCKNDEASNRNLWLQAVLRQQEHKTVFGEQGSIYEDNCSQFKTVVKGNTRCEENPNLLAAGIEAARAGPHKHRLWGDDLVDEKNTLAEAAKIPVVKNAWNHTILPMLDKRSLCQQLGIEGGGAIYYTGTPYTENDLHADLMKEARAGVRWIYEDPFSLYGESETAVYRRLVAGGLDADFHSPIPSLITPAELRAEWERNERAYDLSRRLLPLGLGEKPFRKIFYWVFPQWGIQEKLVRAIGYTPPQPPREQLNPKTRTWPSALVVDPGFTEGRKSSHTGYVVGMSGDDGRVYVLHAAYVKFGWDETLDLLVETAKKWRVDRVVVEAAGQQVSTQRLFRDRGLRCEGISHGNQSKWLRAMDVSAEVNSGRVVLPGWVQIAEDPPTITPYKGGKQYDTGNIRDLVDYLLSFPACKGLDFVDAFVYFCQTMRERASPVAPRKREPEMTGDLERLRLMRAQIFGAKKIPNTRPEWAVFGGR